MCVCALNYQLRTTNDIYASFTIKNSLEKIVAISGKTGENLNQLEEAIASLTKSLELKSNIAASRASAFVLEARRGLTGYNGTLYSCIMKQGKLKVSYTK